MLNFRHNISKAVAGSAAGLFPDAALTDSDIFDMLEYPPDADKGDVALPCFKLSRALRKAPPMIASSLAASLTDNPGFTASADGGYLNFKMTAAAISSVMDEIEGAGDAYGSSDIGHGKTIVLDYASPNVAKPFHIGHLGTTVIGHSLKLLHQFAGYKCVGINHLGDWGTQFGKLIVAYRKWGSREEIENGGIDALVALYVKFHAEAEKDPSLDQAARDEFKKLEEHDGDNTALWKWFLKISLKEYEITFAQLGIKFDSYMGESAYIDKVPEQLQVLRDKHLLKLDDGASVVDLEKYGMPPCLILKSDGSTLYHTRDIAAAVYRKRTYDFYKCIIITCAGQCLHFAQLFKVIELMGYDWYDKLIHVPYGTVSIGGEKLATRTGNVILLRDLFATAIEKSRALVEEKNPTLDNKDEVAEAVGVGAIVFHYLYNSRIKDINFSMDSALSFEGSTGPYAQYTYARTCSILEKCAGIGRDEAFVTATEGEAALVKVLAMFPEKVLQAVADLEPSVITRYIIDVCTSFNRFYHDCPIITAEDAAVRSSRIKMTQATSTVLANAMHLICMKTPRRI